MAAELPQTALPTPDAAATTPAPAADAPTDLADQVEQLLAQMDAPVDDATSESDSFVDQQEMNDAAEEMVRASEQLSESAAPPLQADDGLPPPMATEESAVDSSGQESLGALADDVNQLLEEAESAAKHPAAPIPAMASEPAPPPESSADSPGDLNALDTKLAELTEDLLAKNAPEVPLTSEPANSPAAPPPGVTAGTASTPIEASDGAASSAGPRLRERLVPVAGRVIKHTARAAASLAPPLTHLLALASKPLTRRPESQRQAVGWLAVWTMFMSAIVWGVVVFRPPPREAVAHTSFDFESGHLPPVPNPDEHKSSAKPHKTDSEKGHGGSDAKPPKGGDKKSAKADKSGASASKKETPGGGH